MQRMVGLKVLLMVWATTTCFKIRLGTFQQLTGSFQPLPRWVGTRLEEAIVVVVLVWVVALIVLEALP